MESLANLQSLPNDSLLLIASYLDVHSAIQLSGVEIRLEKLFQDQHLWHAFCVAKCSPHILLLDDIINPNYKHLFTYMHKLSDEDVLSFLQFSWLQRRLNLTIRDPQFLQCYLHLYASKGTENEIKQIMSLDLRASSIKSGIYTMKFKMCPNQLLFSVFFYGERHIYSSVDLVAIGRKLEPHQIKIIDNSLLAGRAGRNSGWHFTNSYHTFPQINARVSPLSYKQLEKIGVSTTIQRTVGGGHETRWDDANTTNWRLQTSESRRSYNVGELIDLEVNIETERLFSSIFPFYSSEK